MGVDTIEARRPTPQLPSDPRRRMFLRRRLLAAGAIVALAVGVFVVTRGDAPTEPPPPEEVRGSPAWTAANYGDADARGFKRRNIVEIEFLGRAMFVHKAAVPHFLRLERIFEARAPDYAASVATGELDDWSYLNRSIRDEAVKSNHAYGIAIDINALANPLGTAGDMPAEVVSQWEAEGGDWGGDWSRADPMHFETHLTPEEINDRYRPDGTPRPWYLEELVGAAS
jgi:D-alanyl-D-alanine carboxypeptidase